MLLGQPGLGGRCVNTGGQTEMRELDGVSAATAALPALCPLGGPRLQGIATVERAVINKKKEGIELLVEGTNLRVRLTECGFPLEPGASWCPRAGA